MKKSNNKSTALSKGFTLIELLVVIAIIGILSSVVLASLNSARSKARDAKRVSDAHQITNALNLYYDSNQRYPQAISDLVAAGFLPVEPSDPLASTTKYKYAVDANPATKYHLGTLLEQAPLDSGVLASDKDCRSDSASAPSCFGAVVTGGFNGVDASGNLMYDLMP